jgi:hypothetical protein
MNKIVSTLALGATLASAASAQTTVYSQSFVGSLPSGFPGLYSATNLDGAGGSAEIQSNTFTGFDIAGPVSINQIITAGAFQFSFYLDTNATANFSGSRIKFFSTGTVSPDGFGINFNYTALSDTFTVWAQSTNGNQAATSIAVAAGSLISGSVTFPSATIGNVSVTADGGVTVTSVAGSAFVAGDIGDRGVFRSQLGSTFLIDGINITTSAIPEPSSFAALAGFAALGFVASRRRRA